MSIYSSCKNGDIDYVIKHINKNNINTSNYYDKTPFSSACEYGHIEIVKLLMTVSGFDSFNNVDNYFRTPFELACFNGHIEIVKLLLNVYGINKLCSEKYNDGVSSVGLACHNRHIEIVKLLIFSMERTDKFYMTSFNVVCHYGYVEIAKQLLIHHIIMLDDINNHIDDYIYEIQSLIFSFIEDPYATRKRLILENNIDVFRHVIFLCDGYYKKLN